MKRLLFVLLAVSAMPSLGQKLHRKPVAVVPKLVVYDVNGKATTLKELGKDKVLFVDFWFVPCGPCFMEMHMLHKLYAKYKDNPKVAFAAITFSSKTVVKPLLENRDTPNNKTYSYFKSLAHLNTFSLPVYFLTGNDSPAKAFMEARMYPESIFGFSGYPTIFIFDKKGNTIYTKTAFIKAGEKQQEMTIERAINAKL